MFVVTRSIKGGMNKSKVAQFAHVWVGPLGKHGKDDPTLVKELKERITIKPPNPVACTFFFLFNSQVQVNNISIRHFLILTF